MPFQKGQDVQEAKNLLDTIFLGEPGVVKNKKYIYLKYTNGNDNTYNIDTQLYCMYCYIISICIF